jgi:long-chain-fatty-acid--CoA ligase ACSBG
LELWSFFLHEKKGIQRANAKAISNVARVKKFTILPRDFSIVGGELGNTFKLKRAFVANKYAEFIEKMYADDAAE